MLLIPQTLESNGFEVCAFNITGGFHTAERDQKKLSARGFRARISVGVWLNSTQSWWPSRWKALLKLFRELI